jgi:hypothetical protein
MGVTMSWPMSSDYQSAIQHPQICFRDPQLKRGTVAQTPLGLPRLATGRFACVFEVGNGAYRWAVRCFLQEVSDQARRYSLLSQHLKDISLASLVDFEYQPQGILVQRQWYPIVRMAWVEGKTLQLFITEHLHDAKTLLNLAAQWRGLVNSLRGNRLAHGDLQHGNVLVTPQKEIRLVDYDAMFIPALRGEMSPELGHENYQHPKRNENHYDESLDNFAALVIYTSLRAVTTEPQLWDQFHGEDDEKLLFSAADYKAARQSGIFQRLKRNGDPDVCRLTGQIEQFCLDPPEHTPDLESVITTFGTIKQGSSALLLKSKQQRSQPKTGEQLARDAAEKARRGAARAKPAFFKNLFNKGRCIVGAHKGEWFYDAPDQCTQIQICELCDIKSTREEHEWSEWQFQSHDKCDTVRECSRCEEVEYDVEHEWARWEYIDSNDCTQAQICDRCKERSDHTRVIHQWKEWKYHALERTRTCRRCQETMSEPFSPSESVNYSSSVAVSRSMSLTGIWVAGDGLPVQFQQAGNQVAFRGVNAFGVVVVDGQGMIQGSDVYLAFRYYDGYVYDQGKTVMQISSNGQQMSGMVQYAVSGMRRPMQLVKQI